MKLTIIVFGTVLLTAACVSNSGTGQVVSIGDSNIAAVSAFAETTPTSRDGANDPAIWISRKNTDQSLILASGAEGGLEIYNVNGERTGTLTGRPISLVDVHYGFPMESTTVDIMIAYDYSEAALVAYAIDGDGRGLTEISARVFPTEAELGGLCIYRSPLSSKYYVFAATSAGTIQQWELFAQAGALDGRLIRSVPVGFGAGHCVAHDSGSAIYFTEETVGVWKLNAEPESDAEKVPVDIVAPFGNFAGDVKGVAIYEFDDGKGYLVASDADENRFQVYDLGSGEHAGTFTIHSGESSDAVEETEGIAIASMPFGGLASGGLLVVADEYNGDEHTNYKLVDWRTIATRLDLRPGNPLDPTSPPASSTNIVSPSVETEPVENFGDTADDAAIWIHPTDPAQSLIIGTQKQHGINVYDLAGRKLQSLPDGRINNADIRYGFDIGGKSVDIVTASNRSNDSIGIYAVDLASLTLRDVADGVIDTGMTDPYGQCMYRSATSGDYFVFINNNDGLVKQWKLEATDNDRVAARLVRQFNVGSQTEGCVADDATGDLYIGEEDVGIWKYSAEPDGGENRLLVDSVDGGNLTADVEGLSIYYGPGDAGYLIASSQGSDNYVVYDRAGDNSFIGLFHIVADEVLGIDGVSETDGLDVSSANLGAAFPYGVFVVQDGRNISPDERQNFKLVPWQRIAEAMGLETYAGYNPRVTNNQQ